MNPPLVWRRAQAHIPQHLEACSRPEPGESRGRWQVHAPAAPPKGCPPPPLRRTRFHRKPASEAPSGDRQDSPERSESGGQWLSQVSSSHHDPSHPLPAKMWRRTQRRTCAPLVVRQQQPPPRPAPPLGKRPDFRGQLRKRGWLSARSPTLCRERFVVRHWRAAVAVAFAHHSPLGLAEAGQTPQPPLHCAVCRQRIIAARGLQEAQLSQDLKLLPGGRRKTRRCG